MVASDGEAFPREAADSDDAASVLALLDAFRRRDARELQRLASRGVNLESRDGRGCTVLMLAAQLGEPGTLQWILEAGARVDARASGGVHRGRDALMMAAAAGNGGIVDLLLAAGASTTAKDADGARAIDLAARAEHAAIAQRLLPVSGGPPKISRRGIVDVPVVRVEERGIGRDDGDDTTILVRSTPADVAAWWQGRHRASVWRRDAYGEEVRMTERCFLVFRFRDHPWTSIRAVHHPSGLDLLAEDAAALAEALGSEVVYFDHRASEQCLRYYYYRGGRSVRSVVWPPAPADSGTVDEESVSDVFDSRLVDHFSDRFDDHFDDAQPSEPRLSTYTDLVACLRRVDTHLRDLDAYIPSWGRLEGEVQRLEIAGLDPTAFERMDFLAI